MGQLKICASLAQNVARPAANRFKAAALHLCDWPLAAKLPYDTCYSPKIVQKTRRKDRGLEPGAFSAYWSRFRSSRLTSSTHNLTSRGEATKCKLNIQCNILQHCNTSALFKERDHAIWNHMEPTGRLQTGHSMIFSLFGSARSDLLNPTRSIWWFH